MKTAKKLNKRFGVYKSNKLIYENDKLKKCISYIYNLNYSLFNDRKEEIYIIDKETGLELIN